MPQSIPRGLTREHVLRAIADLEGGTPHGFGEPTKYELVHEGRRYAPKAVIGLAAIYLTGKVLEPQNFSGGEAPGQANYVLRQLGFTVVPKGEAVAEPAPAGKDWSETEVALVVADYFSMLRAELFGLRYSKTEHRNALKPFLQSRSDGSVEFKHQNISAVLVGMGLPYIAGYKPRSNYQAALVRAVEGFLDQSPDYLGELVDSPAVSAEAVPVATIKGLDEIFEGAPDAVAFSSIGRPWETRKARRVDFAERDANNRQLGKMGEEFVIEL